MEDKKSSMVKLDTIREMAGEIMERREGVPKSITRGAVKSALRKAKIRYKLSGTGEGIEVEVSDKDHSKAMRVLRRETGREWKGHDTGNGIWMLALDPYASVTY